MYEYRLREEAKKELTLAGMREDNPFIKNIINTHRMFLPDVYFAGEVELGDILWKALIVVSTDRTVVVLCTKNEHMVYGDAYGDLDYTIDKVSVVDNDIFIEGFKRTDTLELSLEKDKHSKGLKVSVKWK